MGQAMFSPALVADASALIAELAAQHCRVATAESCTGGLVAALLTAIPGSSRVLDRGFITYTNVAKTEMLGVEASLIAAVGAVSREVALAMAEGALRHSRAQVAVAVTGLAGPDGGTALKPVGLVHIAAVRRGAAPLHHECRFGAIGRDAIRLASVAQAIALLRDAACAPAGPTG
jgi:nicotinamide-nucleotide amidase